MMAASSLAGLVLLRMCAFCDHCITSGITGAQGEPGGQGGHSSFLSDTRTDLANAELIAHLAFS